MSCAKMKAPGSQQHGVSSPRAPTGPSDQTVVLFRHWPEETALAYPRSEQVGDIVPSGSFVWTSPCSALGSAKGE